MTLRLLPGLLLIGLYSCGEKMTNKTNYFNVDSLIDVHINRLAIQKPEATKTIVINEFEETLVIRPDSALWAHELDIFRHLGILNKPIYAASYKVIDGLKDSHSNLILRGYYALGEIPIKEFKVYYQGSFEKLRKIEAIVEERNALYFTSRSFVMTFDHLPEGMVMQHYAVEGFQKMILKDTVRFSLSADIAY